MASKTWVPGTVIDSAWLQDVNNVVYGGIPATGSPLPGDVEVVGSPLAFPGLDPTGTLECGTALQAFFDACRGRRGTLPKGRYKSSRTLAIDPLYAMDVSGAGWSSDTLDEGTVIEFTDPTKNGFEIIYSYAQWPPGGGADAHTQYDILNGIPSKGNSDQVVRLKGIRVQGPGADKTPSTQNIQLQAAGLTTVSTGNGIFAYWANALVLEDCWVSNWPGCGLTGYWNFGMSVIRGFYVGNLAAGIALYDTNNIVNIRGTRCIGNGQKSGPFINFNCLVGSTNSNFRNLGVSIDEDCDFESGGYGALAGYSFSHRASTITACTVTGGIATVTLVGTINFLPGHYIGITGGSTFVGNAPLNSTEPTVISTVSGSQITFPTTAPDGTYAVDNLVIGPYVVGLGLQNCFATSVKGYSEATTGPAVYIYNDCRGVRVGESHLSGSPIYVESWLSAISAFIVSGGTGYSVNDVLTLSGGKLVVGGSPARIKVLSVDGGGAITNLEYNVSGAETGRYKEFPTGTITLTGGTGSGATITAGYAPSTPKGVQLAGNQFYGVNGGIFSYAAAGIQLSGNQYIQTGVEIPTLYLGVEMETAAPNLREAGFTIDSGLSVSRGINQYVSPEFPGDITNTFIGVGGGLNLQGTSSATATQNTVVGHQSGKSITTGYNNTIFGSRAGQFITTGFSNVVVGPRAMDADLSTTGNNLQSMVAIGFRAGFNTLSGGGDVIIGNAAGVKDGGAAPTGGSNVFIGQNSGRCSAVQEHIRCTIVGAQGSSMTGTNLDNFVALGYDTASDSFKANNRTVIGNSNTIAAKVHGILVPGKVYTVAAGADQLPSASATFEGARAYVNDANATTFNSIVASGGSNKVPVFCDGTNWRIG